MKARDVMTRDVLTIDPDATVLQAVRIMLQHKVSGLPVVESAGDLVGIVSEGDFLRRAETGTERRRPRWLEFLVGPGKLAEDYVHTHARKISDVMTLEPVTVLEETTLDDVIRLMERHRIKRLPVMREGKVVGLVSRANLMRALASVLPAMPAAEASDAEIRRRFMAELEKQKWAPVAALEVIVLRGTVDIWGTLIDDRTRQAIIVAAENIPGVKGVNDHMVWVDPVSGMVVAPPKMSPDRISVA